MRQISQHVHAVLKRESSQRVFTEQSSLLLDLVLKQQLHQSGGESGVIEQWHRWGCTEQTLFVSLIERSQQQFQCRRVAQTREYLHGTRFGK